MKFLSIIFFMSLIALSLNAVSMTTFDLKSGQSVQTGSNVKVKIIVAATAGTEGDTQAFKTGTFELVKSDEATVKATLTCSLTTAVTATYHSTSPVSPEAECTVESLTTAGTYKLNAVSAATSDGTTAISGKEVKASGNTLTVTAAPAVGSGGSGDGNTNTDGAKFLTSFYSLIALILFL